MKFRRQRREEVNVNLTPLIDVVFLLLIFFMVSTTFTKESHLEIDLPESSQEVTQELPQVLEIVINAEGNYSVNGQPLVNTNPKTLRQALRKSIENNDEKPPLIITADANTPHQSVVTAMDVAGSMGFSKLSITTKRNEDDN